MDWQKEAQRQMRAECPAEEAFVASSCAWASAICLSTSAKLFEARVS